MNQLSSFNGGAAGVHLAFLLMGPEDDVANLKAKKSPYQQTWEPYTPHKRAVINNYFQNSGLGQPMVAVISKQADRLSKSYIVGKFPAIQANAQTGATQSSWVNARGFWSVDQFALKVGANGMFNISGPMMMLVCELAGQLDNFADLVGLCKGKNRLIQMSKTPMTTITPLFGMPFQHRTSEAFTLGSIAAQPVTANVLTKPMNQMIINWGNVDTSKSVFSIPTDVSTGQLIGQNSVAFHFSSNLVWLGPEEKKANWWVYVERLFKEVTKVGSKTFAASAQPHAEDVDLNLKGLCTWIAVTVQSVDDIQSGNWTRLCDPKGQDWIDELMININGTAREDGLPAVAYRTIKPLEVFGVKPQRHIYVFPYELDGKIDSPQLLNGHENFTNVEKAVAAIKFRAHKCQLQVDVYTSTVNGWWTEKGLCQRLWV